METENRNVRLATAEGVIELCSRRLPREFLEWQLGSRRELFRLMRSGEMEGIRVMPSHLPVMATHGEGDYPLNLAVKGMGLLPRPDLLEETIRRFQTVLRGASSGPWEDSLESRIDAVEDLYSDVGNLDPYLLGGLEIFEGRTFENLKRDPRAYLLFAGEAPRFPSYQLNGMVEHVQEGDLYYDFLLAARELFARDRFHVPQTLYPHAFLFHPIEIMDKRPFTRR